MKDLYFEKDSTRGIHKTLLKLVEEVGELAEAVLLEDTDKMTEEVIDVIAWTLSIANLIDINIEKDFFTKYPNFCPQCERNPCNCKSI